MAAITLTSAASRYTALQSGVSATTTNWVTVPRGFSVVTFHLDISAAGTSTTPVVKAAFLGTLDDARVITLLTGSTITATGYHTYSIGPGLTAVADSPTVSTAAAAVTGLPMIVGLTCTVVGVPTYSTAVEFRGKI